MMPGGSGLEIVRHLNERSGAPARPLHRRLGVLGRGRLRRRPRRRRGGLCLEAVRPGRPVGDRRLAPVGRPLKWLARRADRLVQDAVRPGRRQRRDGADRRARARRDRRARDPRRRRIRVRPLAMSNLRGSTNEQVHREPGDDGDAPARARRRRARPEPARIRAHAEQADPRRTGRQPRRALAPAISALEKQSSTPSAARCRSCARRGGQARAYVSDYGNPDPQIAEETRRRRGRRRRRARG